MGAARLLAVLLLVPMAKPALAASGYTIPGSDDIEPVRPEFEMLFSPPKEWGFECTPDIPLADRRRVVASADEVLSAVSTADVSLAALLELGRAWRCLAWAELDVDDPPELPANATEQQQMERMDRMTREPLAQYELAKVRSCFWLTQPPVQQAAAAPELEQILCSAVLWECYHSPTPMAVAVTRLVDLFPNSACRWPAEITLADAWFKNAMLEPAIKAFRRIEAAATRPNWKAYATYRQAWVLFNLGEFQPALEGLIGAITAMAACTSNDPKEKEQFRRITLAMCDDLPAVYAAAGQPAKARAFVERLAGERTGRILMALAKRYEELGECNSAQVVAQSVMPLLPNPVDRLAMKTLQAECAATSADTASWLNALAGVAEELAAYLAAPEVLEEGSAKAMLAEYVLKDTQQCLLTACTTTIKGARKTKAAEGFEAATSFCQPYLQAFPTMDHAAQVHGLLGGLASDLSLFPQAMNHLERCIALNDAKWTPSCRTELRCVCDHPNLPDDLHGRCPAP